MQEMKDNRSLGELFAELASETSTLVRQEVSLAKVELSQAATKLAKNAALLIVGASLAYAAFQALMVTGIVLLSWVLPLWGAALVVAVVVAIIAWALISKARHALKQADLVPQQTVETLKEDAQWAKRQIG